MMIPEFRADQGGGYGGPARITSHGVSPPNSSAVEIFSRYRPIAPKPLTLKPGESAGSAPSDPPSSSTLSFERTSGGKAVSSDRTRGKRSRKRIGSEPLLPPPRRAKRGPAVKPRTVGGKEPAVIGGIQKAVEQFAPDKSGLQPMPAIPIVGGYRSLKGGATVAYVSEPLGSMYDALEGHGGGSVKPDRRKYAHGFGALTFGKPTAGNDYSPRAGSFPDSCTPSANDGSAGEEPAFMVRAAAASCPQQFSERESNGVQKMRGYDVGYDNSPKCGPDGQPYTAPSIRSVDFMRTSSALTIKGEKVADHLSFARSIGESDMISDGNSRKANLVTLSLLPDTPSHYNNSSEASRPTSLNHVPYLTLAMGFDSRSWDAETKPECPEELHKLSLFDRRYEEDWRNGIGEKDKDRSWGRSSSSDKQSRALDGRAFQEPLDKASRVPVSCRDSEDRAAVIDAVHMDQKYSASCDPMVVTDAESGEILWANQAYKKADTERNCGKTKDTGAPYLDPLGVPTSQSSFEYQTVQGSRTKAILWGFLKKFMRPETNGVTLHPEGRGAGEDKNRQSPERNSHPKPITPQAVRPVGSTLTLERVYSMDQLASPITENLESVKEQLESAATPSVITDYKNRVSWVNAAYKQMVGQPECSWLASTVGKKTSREPSQQNRLMGEVMLTCDEQLSQLSAQFSCRVHVRWTNDGEENSITVPSQVARIENEKRVDMFVWKLDMMSNFRVQNEAWRHDAGQFKHSSIPQCKSNDQ